MLTTDIMQLDAILNCHYLKFLFHANYSD